MYYVLLILILNSLGLGAQTHSTYRLARYSLNPYNPILLGGYAPPKHTHGRGTLLATPWSQEVASSCVIISCVPCMCHACMYLSPTGKVQILGADDHTSTGC